MNKKIPVLIDCDGGVDSLWGLALAAASERIDLRAVTVCAGKEKPECAFENAAAYAAALNLGCPLYKGSERSILLREKPVRKLNGPDGRLGISLPSPVDYECEYAWDAIYQQAKKWDGELTLVFFGPMTNLAIALFKYEDLASLIKKVLFVGGSYDFGNVSGVVEINMATDPEAARAVFRSKIPKMMVGFNAIRESALSEEQIQAIGGENRAGELFLQTSNGRKELLNRVCYGAALGMAALIEPELISWVRYHLTIETRSSICRGRTTPLNMYSPRGFEKDTDIAMSVNMEGYMDLLKNAVAGMDVKEWT